MTFKVLVCGGRNFKGRQRVYDVLNQIHAKTPLTHVIHGAAPGADSIAGQWAGLKGVQEVKCPANWDVHKKAGGPIRNRLMLGLKPDLVIAFPGGPGTADMVKAAQEVGVAVIMIEGMP